MKKLFFTLLASIVFISMYGQVPQEINYQGVARNSSGTLLSNQNIGIKLDLHQGSAGGTIVFSETHNKTTNVFGLFTLGIGSVNASGFTAINWANGPYFLEVSMDPAGGTSYSSVGTQQFMSVPYALYAQTAGNASATPTITINAPNTVTSAAGSYTINVPAAISYSAGTGIDITGGVISNTASATTPTIVGTGATTVTGTYPNLTINTPTVAADQTVSLVGTGTATVTGSYPNFTVNVPSGSNLPTGLNGQFLYHTGTIWDTLPRTNLYFDGTNIGIGTISPQANFHVVGAGRFDASVLTPHVFTNTLTVSGGTLGQVLTSDASGNGTFQNLPSVSSTSLTQGANVTVVGSSPSYTVSAPAYSISLPGGNVVQITNGVSTSTAPIAATNLTLGGANNNILSAGGNTVGLNTYTAGTGISISGTAPNYTLSSPNQSLTINSNSLSITGGNTVTIPTSTINGSGMGIATVTTSVNNFTVNVPSPTYTASSGVLSFGGTNTVVVTPTLSLTGTTLTSGPTTNSVNLSSLSVWSNSVGVLSPTILSNSVGIGTSGPISGKVEISHSATAANPHLNFVSPSAVYGRIKYSNTGQANYFSTEYINDGSGINEAYSINQFNGTNSKPVFLINGQRMTYINALNFPLATFHVMTSTATANGGIASEGFAQGGQLNIVRNNNAGAGARTAIVFGDEIGKINFAGYDGTGYGDGAKIYAKATENVTGSNKGTELIFAAVPTGTNISKEVFKINGANKLEVMTGLLIPNNSGAGKVLTSDALGNASWQVLTPPPAAPWIQGVGIVTQGIINDKVGIGTGAPQSLLEVATDGSLVNGLRVSNSSSTTNGPSIYLDGQNQDWTITGANSGNGSGANKFVIRDYSNAADRFVIDNTGKVGVGLVSPEGMLHVRNSAGSQVKLGNNNQPFFEWYFDVDGSANMFVKNENLSSPVMSFNPNNGFIGVGTGTASAINKFHINGGLAITDGTEGVGKVLVSDASGNASWMPISKMTYSTASCQNITTVSVTPVKFPTNLGTVVKTYSDTHLEVILQADINVLDLIAPANSVTYQLRVSGILPSGNTGKAVYYVDNAGSFVISNNKGITIIGEFDGLAAGTYNVELWAYCGSGSASGVYIDYGCFGGTSVIIKEFK